MFFEKGPKEKNKKDRQYEMIIYAFEFIPIFDYQNIKNMRKDYD